jgi:two-component system chemotaxis response regulator CheY
MLLKTPSLLITDDDRDFRETLRDVFEPRGFRTLLASDGEQALRIASNEPVHLLVTDMHMPRLSGLETIHRLRQLCVSVPCILLSAQLDERITEEARQAAVFRFLPKPVSFRDLTDVVTQAMRSAYNWP